MSLKTDLNYYNEDNFIESDGKLHELTVEITLEEYRNLIIERSHNDIELEKLREENKQSKETIESLTKIILDGNSELKSALEFVTTKPWAELEKAFTVTESESEVQNNE